MDTTLQDYAYMAYHAYTTCINRNGGRYREDMPKHMNHWNKVAKLCYDHEVDPETLVNARFDHAEEHLRKTIKPRMLYTPVAAVLDMLHKYESKGTEYWQKTWKTMKARLGMSEHILQSSHLSEEDLLADPNQPFSSWFRIAYPAELTDRLKDWYLAAAVEEYNADAKLRTFIKEELNGRSERFSGEL